MNNQSAGRPATLSPEPSDGDIRNYAYEKSTVFVNLTKADIQQTAENEVAKASV